MKKYKVMKTPHTTERAHWVTIALITRYQEIKQPFREIFGIKKYKVMKMPHAKRVNCLTIALVTSYQETKQPFREIFGMFVYLAAAAWPDIPDHFNQFCSNHSKMH